MADQPSFSYSTIAKQFFDDVGVSAAWLIRHYPVELKRFMLACDMGETGIELPRARPGEHMLVPAADAWIGLVCAESPKSVIAGIAVPKVMELVRIAKALNGNGYALKSLKWKNTDNLHLAMVQRMGMALNLIAIDQQGEAVRLAAVQTDGLALVCIPFDEQSETVRLAAVKQNGWALGYIPAEQRSEALIIAAVKQDGDAIQYISAEKQSENVRLSAVQQSGLALKYITANHQSEAVRLAAVRQTGCALQYIPADQQSEAVRLAAVNQTDWALQWIPHEMQSRAVRLTALKANKSSSNYMPPEIAKELLAELTGRDWISPPQKGYVAAIEAQHAY